MKRTGTNDQGTTAPSDPMLAKPSALAGQRTAGGSPPHFIQRLLQSGSAASLRQLCFGHPNTQKGTRLLQLGSRCIGCTPSSSMTGWWPGLRSMACTAQFRLASARANHPFITSLPCVTSSTGPYRSSAPCLCHSWIFRRLITQCSMACSGLDWRALAWAQSWLPSSPCMPVAPSS